MRANLRFALPVVFALAVIARPASGSAIHATPAAHATRSQIAGLYNLTLTGVKTSAQQRVDLILERNDAGYSGLLLSDANAVALSDVAFDGTTLRADAVTSAGRGTLVLTITEDGLTGTLTVGRHTIKVKGQRAE